MSSTQLNPRTDSDGDIRRILDKHPALNDMGYGRSNLWKSDQDQIISRLELTLSTDRIRAAQAWIGENLTRRQTINPAFSSYLLKHQCEADIGYLTNGVFITAMLLSGYDMKVWPGSINVAFNVTMRSARAAWEKAKRV